ncbi:cadherin-like beta sandwich domain-containing protein [Erysipelothrix anatis]|uniref:cadherin-like beta sandwich domain-containing protein n=1 Tax=Erysipelothrix anatis TaxID=2683713 RepID=UPI001358BAB1|nr:cadherin-like beta sandwich domain-containing protein [Erysipelothrix anatis]
MRKIATMFRKKIKVIAVLFMVVTMITMHLVMPLSANSPKLTVLPSTQKVSRGQQITVEIQVNHTELLKSGVDGYSGTLKYDPSVLSYVESKNSIKGWAFSSTPSAGTLRFVGYDDTPPSLAQKSDVVLFEVAFEVLAGAPDGDTAVTLENASVADANFNEQNAMVEGATLTIGDPEVPSEQSNNSSLARLEIKNGESVIPLNPAFDPKHKEYTITVGQDVDTIDISALVDDANGTILSGTGNHQLKDGENLIDIVVKAEDDSTSTYTVKIIKGKNPNDKSSNIQLSSLLVTDNQKPVVLTPTFKSDVFDYKATVSATTSTVDIKAVPVDAKAKLISGNGTHDLKEGINLIKVIVEAEDGTRRTYTVEITKEKPTDPTNPIKKDALINLEVFNADAALPLNPIFKSDIKSYTVNVDKSVEIVTILPTLADKESRIISGEGVQVLKEGKNTITVEILSKEGVRDTYTIVVNREVKGDPGTDGNNGNNGGNTGNNGGNTGNNGGNTGNNGGNTGNNGGNTGNNGGNTGNNGGNTGNNGGNTGNNGGNTGNTGNNSGSTGSNGGNTGNNGNNGSNPGNNSGNAGNNGNSGNGTPGANNTVNVSTNNHISAIEGLNLVPAFSRDVTHYQATVGKEIVNLNLNVISEDPNSRIVIEGANNLKPGHNIVTIKVIAADQSERSISIDVMKGTAETSGKLSALSVGAYAINPGFQEDVLYYTMSVENSVTSLAVTATPKFGNTSVNISGNQKLYPGMNYIKVHATGADGVMSTYVVEVNREASPSSNISIHPAFIWLGSGIVVLISVIIILVVTRKREYYNSSNPGASNSKQ